MGLNTLALSVVSTALSVAGLQIWAGISLDKLWTEGLTIENLINAENASHALDSHLDSYAAIALLANFVFNAFFLFIQSLKTIFFSELYSSETKKLLELLFNYVIYKGTFLPLVVPPTTSQIGLWAIWLTVICCLKMFQALARDRLERLNASPSVTPWSYFRVFSVLLLALSADVFWIRLCLLMHKSLGSSVCLLLLFEPLSIFFDTLQAVLIHGFQLLDIWIHDSGINNRNCQRSKLFDFSAAGSVGEWKGILIRNLGFVLDMVTLLMALGHYLDIWWIHGMAFHLIDTLLFFNIRVNICSLLTAIWKRVKGFNKLRRALRSLHAAFPDATSEEIQAYDDECAICREPMAKAKKLHCNHLFHLACLRSWMDQGLNEVYSCPTCRKPLLLSRSENQLNAQSREVSNNVPVADQTTAGFGQQNAPAGTLPAGIFSNQIQNPMEGSPWRSAGLDSSWLHSWPNQDVDGAGPSAMRPVGLGRVQLMMRHLASVGETYAQTSLEDTALGLWPMNQSQTALSGSSIPPGVGGRYNGTLRMRTTSRTTNNMANILAMTASVREILPHIPEEMIYEDLQRTNSVAVTVNNLLQM